MVVSLKRRENCARLNTGLEASWIHAYFSPISAPCARSRMARWLTGGVEGFDGILAVYGGGGPPAGKFKQLRYVLCFGPLFDLGVDISPPMMHITTRCSNYRIWETRAIHHPPITTKCLLPHAYVEFGEYCYILCLSIFYLKFP